MYLLYILNVKKKKDKFEFRIRFSPNITHKLVTFSIVMHNINKKKTKDNFNQLELALEYINNLIYLLKIFEIYFGVLTL